MANNFHRSIAAVNAEANAVCALLDGGHLDIYDVGVTPGTQPATADTALGDQVLLATLPFDAAAAGAAVDGVATFAALTPDADAAATGTAAWFRACNASNAGIFDGTVGTSGCDCNINSVAIQQNAAVSVVSMTYTAVKNA
jgi:hypothetical protein